VNDVYVRIFLATPFMRAKDYKPPNDDQGRPMTTKILSTYANDSYVREGYGV
jgi:hypothetical protein